MNPTRNAATGGDAATEPGRGWEPTPMQRSLWASQRRQPTAPVQNMALLTHLDGPVDPDRLVRAFSAVVDASDVLGSRLTTTDGATTLRPTDGPAVTDVIEIERSAVASWARTRVATPLDVAVRGYDSVLARHEDGTASWYLALHHTLTDATSSLLVFDATAAAYRGERVELDSYYDWARRLERPDDPRRARAQRHWSERPPAPRAGHLYRPVRRPDPATERVPIAMDEVADRLTDRLGSDLRMLSEELGWTTVLMTAAAELLHRLTGADRFAIGLPVHNRNDPESRRLVGPVMEVFPVDIEVVAGDTHRSLHKRISRAVLAALRHALPGTAPATADLEVVVNVITRAGLGSFAGIPTTTTWIHSGAADPSHLFSVQMTSYGSGGPTLSLDVNTSAADPVQRRRAEGHVRAILDAIGRDPDAAIGTVALCGERERAELAAWGDGPPDPGPTTSVALLLARRLRGRGAPVLEDRERVLTGDELWSRVVATATWLRGHGVEAGVRVGVEMGRSIDAVVAILATMVAGGSYVPLDPAQPRARRDRLAERAGCRTVLRSLPELAAGPQPEPAWPAASPDDEAYLLFTSGSTGEPKGVPIGHRGLRS